LLKTLEKTTIQVALLGSIIAVLGFIVTLTTGNDFYTYWAGVVSLFVLLYSYPTRKVWGRTLEKFKPQPNEVNSTKPAVS
jgi:hypothetical protein